MSVGAAFRLGVRRVNGAPWVFAGLVALTFLVALPLSIALRGMLAAHLGNSLAAESAVRGVNYGWWQEFSAQAAGLGTTFVPSIMGFGAVLDNLSGLLDNQPLAATIAGITAAWLVLWSFLSGGVIDRYARARPTRAHGFFSACGVHFWRFARLGVVALGVYYMLFAWMHPWLFDGVYRNLTFDTTVERQAFAIRAGGYALFGAVLALCNIVFDYARIRIVVEDRRSALAALVAGWRFVRRHPAAFGVYATNAAAFVGLVLLYAVMSPGAPGDGMWTWVALGLGQIYIVGRHYLKLLFYASETAFFQGSVAHATYTAAPAVVWPESPAAEAVANADSSTLA